MAEFNFDFEPINFGLGAASGVVGTLAAQRIYRFASNFGSDRERAVVRTYATRAADQGYLLALVDYAQTAHLLGHKVRLEDILVEPRFIPPPDVIDIPEEDVPMEEVFTVVPQVHDYPYLHQAYNIPTLSIAELSRGNKSIVMVGVQGSGRTTALLTIALWSAGYLEFEQPRDEIIEQLEQELDPKRDVPIPEQVLRVRRRVAMSEATRLRYKDGQIPDDDDSRPKDPTEEDEEVPLEAPSRFRSIAPLYVHLADVILDSGEYGHHIDPAEPLIRALQRQAGWLSSKRLVNKTYKLLERGSGLVLIDGYDDIPDERRPAAIRWIRALMSYYPDNYFIVAMPPQGYGLLMEAGAVPVYLRPWNYQNVSDSTDKLVAKWEELSKTPIAFDINEYHEIDAYTAEIKPDGRQRHALDNTLRTWSIFKGLEQDATQSEIMQAYLEELLPDAVNLMPELQRLATVQLDKGYITLDNLVTYAMQKAEYGEAEIRRTITNEVDKLASTSEASAIEDNGHGEDGETDYSEFFGNPGDAIATTQNDESSNGNVDNKDEDEDEAKMRRQLEREQDKLLSKLVKSGVMKPYRGGRYQFRHKILASYLAARDLVEADEYIIFRKYRKPDWEYAMNYLAQMRDVDFLVAEQLDNELDVRFENVLKLTNWLKFAGSEAPWRSNLLKYLGNLMAASNQFTVVRERIAAALVSSRDEGAKMIFRRSLKTSSPSMRKLACLALGALRDSGAIEALTQVTFQDQELENRIAGVLGLAAIGTEDALIAVMDLIDMAQNEEVRRAATEMLAANREIGYPTLYDALHSESIAMRRAAVFGVGRIPTDWSWIMVDRTFQQDTESFVRLACEVVLRKKFDTNFYQLDSYPKPTEAPWLVEWAEAQRDYGNIPYDMEIEDVLEFAFEQQDDELVRWLMTGTIGQLGEYDMLEKVYRALQDRSEPIRDEAYRTLSIFQERLGATIPAPL